MKRKTNLFYLDGPDSKFITFSNYTEAMTGNFLSTNTKLFPARFLCLNIKDLTNDNKESFVRNLVRYYESKLAVLRDNIEPTDKLQIAPLNYLFETLLRMKLNKESNIWEFNEGNNVIHFDENNQLINNLFDIVCVNDITEQDYNGTYADTICIVDLGNIISGKLKGAPLDEYNTIGITCPKNYKENKDCLYGWENGIIKDYDNTDDFSLFDNINIIKENEDDENSPSFRDNGEYNINSVITGILLHKPSIDDILNNEKEINEISFNVIIPLCDLVDINYKTNFSSIEEEEIKSDNLTNNIFGIDLTDKNNLYSKNIPYGMWFADEPIVLKRDSATGFSPTWSLTISSQFKPFGYSKYMPHELDQSFNSNAFSTFSQVLTKQNQMINEFSKINTQLSQLKNDLSELSGKINNMATTYNMDRLKIDIKDVENKMNNQLVSFKDEIFDIINNLKWQSAI